METRVCALDAFEPGSRRLSKVGERNVAIFRLRKPHNSREFFAVDNACYHHGGPLVNGDIEDLGGHPCVKCPWHSYPIALDTGECLYWGVDVGAGGKPKPMLKTKGVKQRTHDVIVRDGFVFVSVDVSGPEIASDSYAKMSIANQEGSGSSRHRVGGNAGGIHSSMNSITGHRSGGSLDWPRSTVQVEGNSRAKLTLVQCYKREDSCANGSTSTFEFERCDSSDRDSHRRVVPGMWVKLRIPMQGSEIEDKLVNSIERQWTVSGVRSARNNWFSITVKRRSEDDGGRGGSAMLHRLPLRTPLEVVEFGGSFTLAALRERLNLRKGRLLMVSGGIGITPMYAAVSQLVNDPVALTAGPPVHIVHLHSERHLQELSFIEDLGAAHQQFSSCNVHDTPFSYQLRLARTGSSISDENETSVAQKLGSNIFSGRISESHIASAIGRLTAPRSVPIHTSSNVTSDPKLLVMLCGPTPMMHVVRSWCISMGVDPNDIIDEEF